MKISLHLAMAAFAIALSSATSHAGFVTVGTYDPSNDLNDVDQDATFVSGTGGATAANLISLSAFKPLVFSAYNADAGGVIDFNSGNLENAGGGSDNDGGQYVRAPYGISGSKGIEFSSNDASDDFDYPGATSNNRLAISGTNANMTLGKDSGNVHFNLTSVRSRAGRPVKPSRTLA